MMRQFRPLRVHLYSLSSYSYSISVSYTFFTLLPSEPEHLPPSKSGGRPPTEEIHTLFFVDMTDVHRASGPGISQHLPWQRGRQW